MAKPNYQFEKRQKELLKKQKKLEKQQRKAGLAHEEGDDSIDPAESSSTEAPTPETDQAQ